jgi:glycosyltransferase involved in cell wall biosynthesis
VLRCLYISRYAPDRSPTDPYRGLLTHLCEHSALVGLWNPPDRGRQLPFVPRCETLIEVGRPGLRGWLEKFIAGWRATTADRRPNLIMCGIDEHSLSLGILLGCLRDIPAFCFTEDPPFTSRYDQAGLLKLIERKVRKIVLRRMLRRSAGVFSFVEASSLSEFVSEGLRIHQMMNAPSPQALVRRNKSSGATNQCRYTIGLVGALTPDQGLDTLLDIFSLVATHLPDARLRLVGPLDPAYRTPFERRVLNAGLRDRVEITSWVPYEKMLDHLTDVTVGVYCNPPTPWFHVAQPLKVCEYLGLSKPTVAWDYPGVHRLLDGGRLGILVPPGDISAFADALVSLANPCVRERIEAEIRAATACRWSSAYWYGETLRIMTDCMEGKHDHFPKH